MSSRMKVIQIYSMWNRKLFYKVSILSIICLIFANFYILRAALISVQPTINIICDTSYDGTQIQRPDPFLGTLFQTKFASDGITPIELQQLTSNGIQNFAIPFLSNLDGKVYPTNISPDGRYILFIPIEENSPLVIWEIATSEYATLTLPADDVEYLNRNSQTSQQQREKLVWIDSSHVKIQYFDLDYSLSQQLLAEKILTVSLNPLAITSGLLENIDYPYIDIPIGNIGPAIVFSPLRNYTDVISYQLATSDSKIPYARHQIYNSSTQELIADIQPDLDREYLGSIIWTNDEDRFYLKYRSPDVSSYSQLHLQEFQLGQSLQSNDIIMQTLETEFGAATTLSFNFIPSLNPDNTKLAFHIYVPDQNQYYLVIQDFITETLTAICDANTPSNRESWLPIWEPSDNYFTYWDNGWLITFELSTGKVYRMNGLTYLGWTSSNPNTPTATPHD